MTRIADALYGLPVVTVRSDLIDKPRFKLAENVPVTPEYRAEFNAWARKFFGGEFPIIRVYDSTTKRTQMLMSEDTLADKVRAMGAKIDRNELRAALADLNALTGGAL
jgi:hypothetical protein